MNALKTIGSAVLAAITWLWNWTMEARWRTWLAHALLAALFSLVIGGWATLVLYASREVEQAWMDHLAGKPTDVVDHLMDYLAPLFAVCALVLAGVIPA